MSSRATARTASVSPGIFARFRRWLNQPPAPHLVCEFSAEGVSAARTAGGGRRAFESHAFEPLPEGALVPSPVDLNLVEAGAVAGALGRVLSRVNAHGTEVALIIPDQAVRVFLLQFEAFPRRAEEAVPLLRFRLRKSVPFDSEDSCVSYSIQPAGPPGAAAGTVHILAAIAQRRIIRQYEDLLEARQKRAAVVISSTLAALPLVDDRRPTLLARQAGNTWTTLIASNGALAVYRCTQMPAAADSLAAQSLLDEIYPAAAYFQDTWNESVAEVRLAGFGAHAEEFRAPLEAELKCSVSPVVASAALEERLAGEARAQVDLRMDALVGWMLAD
ncbi:MAG TPA: hypothetical protein VL099_04960 [Candidatus Binatia bacterium]|nr:hypothetical protein [Candidatus Binatia bacterium]